MMAHPDKQRLAQEEIDRVIGNDRLPLVSDRKELRYVDAVIKETMRWSPALPMGTSPHFGRDFSWTYISIHGGYHGCGSILSPVGIYVCFWKI